MPVYNFPLTSQGPTLPVLIGLGGQQTASLPSLAQAAQRSVLLRGILDTASNVTVVPAAIIAQLGLPLHSSRTTTTTAGVINVWLFIASLSIPGPGPAVPMFTRPLLRVMEGTVPLPNVDVVIGQDILSEFLFLQDGPGGRFTLAF